MPYDHETSGPAYTGTAKESRDYCRKMVFITIRKLEVCNDRQISEALGWAINRVTPRRNELVTDGLICLAMKEPDPTTNRTVSWWKVKPVNHQPTLF